MKILNLYAGIGGNRKLWGDEHDITAVEIDPEIAKVYKQFFPKDNVIVADAHQYLLEHFHEYHFIWSSPPCQTHSRLNISNGLSPYANNEGQEAHGGGIKPRYIAMELYQEIVFLQTWFKGKWVIENVVGYYEPLVKPQDIGKHYFWSNFPIIPVKKQSRAHMENVNGLQKRKGFDLSDTDLTEQRKVLRNCVEPKLGLHVFECAFRTKQQLLDSA